MRNLAIILLFAFLQPIYTISQNEEAKKTALLIIDVQEFYFPGGASALVNPEAASEQAAVILNYFRINNDLVVHIKHASKQDSAIHQNVAPVDGEKIIKKENVNSYVDTDLQSYLKENQIENVVICGMMTHMCVEAASRASADYGFNVTVIDDACATRDIIYGNDTVQAKDVHASTLGTINRYYGEVMTVDEYINR